MYKNETEIPFAQKKSSFVDHGGRGGCEHIYIYMSWCAGLLSLMRLCYLAFGLGCGVQGFAASGASRASGLGLNTFKGLGSLP